MNRIFSKNQLVLPPPVSPSQTSSPPLVPPPLKRSASAPTLMLPSPQSPNKKSLSETEEKIPHLMWSDLRKAKFDGLESSEQDQFFYGALFNDKTLIAILDICRMVISKDFDFSNSYDDVKESPVPGISLDVLKGITQKALSEPKFFYFRVVSDLFKAQIEIQEHPDFKPSTPTVFLDVDGVFCPHKATEEITNIGKNFYEIYGREMAPTEFYSLLLQSFCDKALNNILTLVKQNKAQIVLTSSWRKCLSLYWVQERFPEIGPYVLAKTSIINSEPSGVLRHQEILDFVEKHKIEKYCVIDDFPGPNETEMAEALGQHFVLINDKELFRSDEKLKEATKALICDSKSRGEPLSA